jgi:hypothetical protein
VDHLGFHLSVANVSSLPRWRQDDVSTLFTHHDFYDTFVQSMMRCSRRVPSIISWLFDSRGKLQIDTCARTDCADLYTVLKGMLVLTSSPIALYSCAPARLWAHDYFRSYL